MRNGFMTAALVAFVGISATTAQAASLPNYPNPGTLNPDVYNFTVGFTGTVTAYFAGSDAGNDSTLGFFTNSGLNPSEPSGSGIFPNHSTAVGAFQVLGNFTAGDVLTFFIDTAGPNRFYSNRSLNADGINHIYSASFSGDASSGLPAGTYVGFEDLYGGGDKDYNDLNFVFTNTVSSVPLPSSAPLFGAAVLALGLVGYGVKRKKAAANA